MFLLGTIPAVALGIGDSAVHTSSFSLIVLRAKATAVIGTGISIFNDWWRVREQAAILQY
jgi:hypothetical protein